MPVSGDITTLNYSHPTLGSGVLYAKAGEESTYSLGGIRTEDDVNSIDGGGQSIDVMKRERWFFEVPISWDMNDKEELEKLSQMAASPVPGDWTVSHINGIIYGGKGKPVGDVNGNGGAGTIAVKISGGGILKKI